MKLGAVGTLPAEREQALWDGVREARRFFSLPREMGESLDASARPRYEDLWQEAQAADRE
jgi:hypothetical protein